LLVISFWTALISLAFWLASNPTIRCKERQESEGRETKGQLDSPPYFLPFLSSSSLGPITLADAVLTLCPSGVSSENVVYELYAGSSLSLRLSNKLGVTSLVLLNWKRDEKERGEGELFAGRSAGWEEEYGS